MIRFSANRADMIGPDADGGCVHAFCKSSPLPPVSGAGRADETRLSHAWLKVHSRVINSGIGTSPTLLKDEALKFQGLDPEKWSTVLTNMHPIEAALELTAAHVTTQADPVFAFNPQAGLCGQMFGGLRDLGSVADEHPVAIADAMWLENDAATGIITLVLRFYELGQRAMDRAMTAEESRKLAMAAFIGGTSCSADYVRCELRYVLPDGRMVPSDCVYSLLDLAGIEEWLQHVCARIKKGEEPRQGVWCTQNHCPLLVTCEATLQSAQQIERTLPPMALRSLADLTSEDQVIALLTRAQAVKKLTEHLIEMCKAWVDQRGVPLSVGQGKYWGPKQRGSESVYAKSCAELKTQLAGALPEQVIDRLVYATVSKSALETAITANSEPKQGKKRMRDAIDALRKAHMVTRTAVTEHRYYGKKLPEAVDTMGEVVDDVEEQS